MRGDQQSRRVAAAMLAGQPPTKERIADVFDGTEDQLGARGRERAIGDLTRATLGLGPLADVAADPSVTDILVNGDGSVWADRGLGVERCAVALPPSSVRPLAVRLAGAAGRRLDDAAPWVDGVLPDGIRLHAVLPPLAEGGGAVSLRLPRRHPGGLDDLVALGAIVPALRDTLAAVLERRATYLISGATGSGKTTLLAGLISALPRHERVVIVEDVRELEPRHPHVIRLQGRSPNVEGRGGVEMAVLVRQALRMRPDRLVVGEVRGAEVRELLAALNTGHAGGAGTLHANSPGEVPARIEALAALAGLERDAVHAQLRGAIDVVLHARRAGSLRYIEQVGVVVPRRRRVHVEVAVQVCDSRAVPGPGAARLAELLRPLGGLA